MSLLHTITPVSHDLGAFTVRRTLPSKGRIMVGPFIFVDQFGPATFEPGTGMDVRPHPHINLATVTYLFEGAIGHRDSLGTQAVIRPGAINLMTAGRAIVHSERTPAPERATGSPISGMQTWLALADGKEEIDPAFEQVTAEQLPIVETPGVRARVIMGTLWGATSPVTQHSPTIYSDIELRAGASVPIDARADERAIIVAMGSAAIGQQPLDPHSLHILAPGVAVTITASTDVRIMLLGGQAFSTPRHVWWNFVSSSRDRIEQAKDDWRQGRFPTIDGDDQEYIPIPDVPLTRSDP